MIYDLNLQSERYGIVIRKSNAFYIQLDRSSFLPNVFFDRITNVKRNILFYFWQVFAVVKRYSAKARRAVLNHHHPKMVLPYQTCIAANIHIFGQENRRHIFGPEWRKLAQHPKKFRFYLA